MKIFTTGYEKKSARVFFEQLRAHGIECVLDIRLYPDGQIEGYARRDDLDYLLYKVLNCDYQYLSVLTPTGEMLDLYHKEPNWPRYVADYQKLMDERNIPTILDKDLFESKRCCLLCYEASPEQCHRRLAAERMALVWENVEIVHL